MIIQWQVYSNGKGDNYGVYIYIYDYMLNRQAQNETKKQNHSLIERVQSLQVELQDSEVRRNELEGQVRQSHTVSINFITHSIISLWYL